MVVATERLRDEVVSLVMKRIGRGLYPADGLAEEDVWKLPAGPDLRAEVVNPRRSLPQLRLYWAVVDLVAANAYQDVSRQALHQWIKTRLGVIEEVVTLAGEIEVVPGSIALDAMDETAFNDFFQRAMDAICAGLTNMGREDLLAQAERMLDRGDPS